jgi:DNA-binding LacI/PurR family transcriptional regulator
MSAVAMSGRALSIAHRRRVAGSEPRTTNLSQPHCRWGSAPGLLIRCCLPGRCGLGHRHIAVIKGQTFSSDTEPRFQAIQQAAQRAQLRLNPELIAQLEGDSPSHDPGYFATQSLLAAKAPFTAIFTFNDVAAIGAIRAIRETGLRVPQDISIVGFDDVQSAAFQNPGLTTVRQPLRTMGMLAAEAVVRGICSPAEPHAARQLMVDPELIVRESTCPPLGKSSKARL